MPRTARYLLFCYLITLLGPAAIMVNFLLEQDRIAQELCVQREVPEMARTCHGQCHLAKQLKATEEGGRDQEPRIPSFRFEVQFLDATTSVPFQRTSEDRTGYGDLVVAAPRDGFPMALEGVPWC